MHEKQQQTPRGGPDAYEPIERIGGWWCWPAAPDRAQLDTSESIEHGKKTLTRGVDFDDVVLAIRKKLGVSKVGHLGTLDPMATGVLPVAVGKATRIAQFIPNAPKEYEGEIRFGFATNTYDRGGIPTSTERPIEGNVEEAMKALTGTLDQIPPPFSAKKIGGAPAYKLARKNREVKMAATRVEVREFAMAGFDPPLMTFRVVCSPGTYIRSLAHDLGQRLGCGAHEPVAALAGPGGCGPRVARRGLRALPAAPGQSVGSQIRADENQGRSGDRGAGHCHDCAGFIRCRASTGYGSVARPGTLSHGQVVVLQMSSRSSDFLRCLHSRAWQPARSRAQP